MFRESPEYVRTSLAAAMTLGLKPGWFYRDARLFCINLLLTYSSGCAGNCGYCGLSKYRPGTYTEKSFIRVEWPTYRLTEIIQRISEREDCLKRVCLSMITRKQAVRDTCGITETLHRELNIPVSLLISPTILTRDDLVDFQKKGADMVGVAIDCATSTLFEKMRGKGVGGPHDWDTYWRCYQDAIAVFGKRKVGVHLIVGLGETEKEMSEAIQMAFDMGGSTHLFSFFPEGGSSLSGYPQPPMGQYRRIQLARYLIDEGISRSESFRFDAQGRIREYGIPLDQLSSLIKRGTPFMTSGCPDEEGCVACNRPYANCLPGPDIRNYPFHPETTDITRIQTELWRYEDLGGNTCGCP